jgi:hypothetical protein
MVLIHLKFDFPVIIMVMRQFFTVIILHVLRMLQLIQISGYTFSKGKSFAVPSMLYGLNSVLGLNVLSHMNVAMSHDHDDNRKVKYIGSH